MCSYSWDIFFQMIQELTKSLGRLVPIISCVGDHDLGVSGDSGVKITLDEFSPLFFHYFPQHFKTSSGTNKELPPLKERMSYFFHRIGNIVLVSLDAGFVVEENQKEYVEWLTETLEISKKANLMVFANYHIPIYPVCGRNSYDKSSYVKALTFWVPLFDKFKVVAAFENHGHALKRTFGLRKSETVASGGTVYYGEGQWGVPPKECDYESEGDYGEIFAKRGWANHIWVADLYIDHASFKAVGVNGEVHDQNEQSFQEFLGFDSSITK